MDSKPNDTVSRRKTIYADEAIRIVSSYNGTPMIVEQLKQLPPAEPERKKGKWIDMGDFEQCSVCLGTRLKEVQTFYGKAIWIKTDYCPNCGADMRGEQDG